jgi:hypothetical protein
VLTYELADGELRRRAGDRVDRLEAKLFSGGPIVGAEGRAPRLFGVVPASQRLGVGLVYGAALGGWVYLVVWGALEAAGAGRHSPAWGLVAGVVAGLAVVWQLVAVQRPD